MNRIALGTAQFGLTYGIANRKGKVTFPEAQIILNCARDVGINTIDTAMAYGSSEQMLGDIGVSSWKVITKLPSVPNELADITNWIVKEVESSIKRLKISGLYGLLLHRPDQLLNYNGRILFTTLQNLKQKELVKKIGISIYSPEELDALLPAFDFDLVQAPLNILDRRLITSNWLNRLKDYNIEIHVRSIFLQGLLLIKPEDRPKKFTRWEPLWDCWEKWLSVYQLTPLQACLRFVLSLEGIDRIVIGVDSLIQLKEILAAVGKEVPLLPQELICNDINLINPSHWDQL